MSKAETFEGVGSKLHAAWHKAAMGDGSQLVQMRSRQVRKAHEKISRPVRKADLLSRLAPCGDAPGSDRLAGRKNLLGKKI